MGLPDDTQAFMTVEAFQETSLPKSKSQSTIFVKRAKETINIEIDKPATDSSDFLNYLVEEISNAIDRYQPEEK